MSTIQWIRSHPFSLLAALAIGWWILPGSNSAVSNNTDRVDVENGLSFDKEDELNLAIVPFMSQETLMGFPDGAGVSAIVYYVSEDDFFRASEEYQRRGGCWPSTLQRYKRELFVVGEADWLVRRVQNEMPHPNREPQVLHISGNTLLPRQNHPDWEHASVVANGRGGDFFLPVRTDHG